MLAVVVVSIKIGRVARAIFIGPRRFSLFHKVRTFLKYRWFRAGE